jgi:hypothetical protein
MTVTTVIPLRIGYFCFQGGGQVQEQRAGDQQPEATPLPHQVTML